MADIAEPRTLDAQRWEDVGVYYEWLVINALMFGPSLLAIVDMFRFQPPLWRQARQNRPLWIALSVLLGPLGALLYATGPRLVLRRTVRQLRATEVSPPVAR